MVALAAAVALVHVRPASSGRLEERGVKAAGTAAEARRSPSHRRAGRPRSSSRYPVDWRARYLREHAHVQRLLHARRARVVQVHDATDWRARQIAAAEVLGREGDHDGTDPWPNCADPYDHGGASWDDTVACENGGSWLDSPGFYRCGLQFDPSWERRFGRLCP